MARPWELTKTDSVDVLDAVGADIRVDSRGARSAAHSAAPQRGRERGVAGRQEPLRRRRAEAAAAGPAAGCAATASCSAATWPEAFAAIAARLQGARRQPHRRRRRQSRRCREHAGAEGPDGGARLGQSRLPPGRRHADPTRRDFYIFNTSIAGIEEADALLIIGTNPRREAPLINARIRKRWLQGGLPVALIGPAADLTYAVDRIGAGPETIAALLAAAWLRRDAEGREAADADPGPGRAGAAGRRRGSGGLLAARRRAAGMLCARVARLQRAAHRGRAGRRARPRLPAGAGRQAMLGRCWAAGWTCCGCSAPTSSTPPPSGATPSSSTRAATAIAAPRRADVILPGAAYTEKNGTYVNTEGRVQRGALAVYPPGEAREDWKILRAFSASSASPLPYDDIDALRARLEQVNPVFARIDILPRFGCADPGPAGDPARIERRAVRAVDRTTTTRPTRSAAPARPWPNASAALRPRRRRRRSSTMHRMLVAFFATAFGILVLTVLKALAILVPLLIGGRLPHLCRAQGAGGDAAAPRPQRGRPVRPVPAVRRRHQDDDQGDVIPTGANRVLFLLAPMLTFTLAMVAWAVVPVNDGWAIANINVGLLYLFAISSLGVYGIIIAGWASNSKYAFLGALRSAAQMVSYEVSMGFVLVSVLLCVGSLNLNDIVGRSSISGSASRCFRCSWCSSSRRWPRPTGRRSTSPRARARSSPASSSNTAAWRSACSSSANTPT